jgi:hypothetical protein
LVEIESKEGRKTALFIIQPKISKMKYRIPEPGTTISGFADNKKLFNPD